MAATPLPTAPAFFVYVSSVLNRIPHWVLVVLAATVGAAVGYLQQQGPVALLVAVQHWATLRPILMGAAGAAGTMFVGQLRRQPWATAAAAFAIFVVCLTCSACGAGTPPPTTAQLRAIDRGTLEAIDGAWHIAAVACAAASPALDAGAPSKCGAILHEARASLEAASQAVDAWQAAADAGPPAELACDLQAVSKAIDAVALLGVGMPAEVLQAQAAANALTCNPIADGGAHE